MQLGNAGQQASHVAHCTIATGNQWAPTAMSAAAVAFQRDALPVVHVHGLLGDAADAVLMDALGDLLGRSYLAVRRSEARAYAEMSDEAQFRGHFYKY